MSRVEKLRQAELARREAAGEPLVLSEQAKVPKEDNRFLVPIQSAVVTPPEPCMDKPPVSAPKPKKPKRPKWTPAERDAATKGKRRFPVGAYFNARMTGPEEWTVTIHTPDGFVTEQIGPGIHTLLSKLDDAYTAFLRAKQAPEGGTPC